MSNEYIFGKKLLESVGESCDQIFQKMSPFEKNWDIYPKIA